MMRKTTSFGRAMCFLNALREMERARKVSGSGGAKKSKTPAQCEKGNERKDNSNYMVSCQRRKGRSKKKFLWRRENGKQARQWTLCKIKAQPLRRTPQISGR